MKFRVPLFILLICFYFFPTHAQAATKLDQMIGIRLSQRVSQTILAAPPLPSLTEDREHHLIPTGSSLKATAEDSNANDYSTSHYGGKFSGWTGGMGFTESTRKNLSYYGFAMMSQLKGKISMTNYDSSGTQIYNASLDNMQTTGINLAWGLSLRLWSAKKAPFSLGILGGPFASRFSSKFAVSGGGGNYSANSFVYGPSIGAQAFFQPFKIRINPYVLYYHDLSSKCQPYNTDQTQDQGNILDTCSNGGTVRALTLKGSFLAYGLNVGIFGLSFNVYTHLRKDPELESIKITNYALSYTFGF
jgi:hypothetical protein